MFSRTKELYLELCTPKPKIEFKVIDTDVESVPVESEQDDINIKIYFVT